MFQTSFRCHCFCSEWLLSFIYKLNEIKATSLQKQLFCLIEKKWVRFDIKKERCWREFLRLEEFYYFSWNVKVMFYNRETLIGIKISDIFSINFKPLFLKNLITYQFLSSEISRQFFHKQGLNLILIAVTNFFLFAFIFLNSNNKIYAIKKFLGKKLL